VIQSILDDFATNPGSNAYFNASAWRTSLSINNVDNTSDVSKPISTATQTALDAKASAASLTSHTSDTSNPHSVTATQIGLGNADNTSDADKPISTATQTALNLKADDADLTSHTGNTSNPHSVTAAQVGLGSANNTSDADKPVSTATQTALDDKQDILAEGAFVDGDKTRLDKSVISDTTGVTGADQVTNLISLTQAEYDAITPAASTLYIITD
jgi:hypothetical protein